MFIICPRCALVGLVISLDYTSQSVPAGIFTEWGCYGCGLYGCRLVKDKP
jgi:hypothetical protein